MKPMKNIKKNFEKKTAKGPMSPNTYEQSLPKEGNTEMHES